MKDQAHFMVLVSDANREEKGFMEVLMLVKCVLNFKQVYIQGT